MHRCATLPGSECRRAGVRPPAWRSSGPSLVSHASESAPPRVRPSLCRVSPEQSAHGPAAQASCSWLVHTQVPRGPATLWGPTPRPNCAPPLPMTCSRQPDACWSPSVHVSPLSHPPGCSRAPGGHPWRPCAQQGTLPVPVVGLGRQRGAERPVPLGSGGLRCATGLTPAPRCWGPAAAAEGGPGSHMVLSGRMRPRPAPGFAGPLHSHQPLLNFSPSGEPSRNL